MEHPHALVSGASIAGLAAAFWLRRVGWRVTVLEKAPAFRDGGQNVDVRGAAREVVERMGLTEAVRAATTTEEGTRFVDEGGATVGEFPQEGDGDGLTAEMEILRGDLARVILDALPDGVRLRYGETIAAVDERGDSITATLASGGAVHADLLVVAEGVRSSTRDLLFGREVERHPLGLTMAYGTIPRAPTDDRWWNWHVATRGRHVTLRPDAKGTTRATLAYLSDEDLSGLPRDEAVGRLREVFAGVGWAAPRVLEGFAASDDVYVDSLVQIRLPRWSRGRACMLGDAAWCVTPIGGGGSSLALVGGYVLAAFVSQLPLEGALAEYEAWMRPLVDDAQSLPPGVPRVVYPKSRVGVEVLEALARVASTAPVRAVVGRFGGVAESTRALPELRAAR